MKISTKGRYALRMMIDLARNDLNRNTTGVYVKSYKEIQFYSHVIHMVSRVCGRVASETNRIRLFADTFPAGTLSGAPKVRAMQLIDQIESHAAASAISVSTET